MNHVFLGNVGFSKDQLHDAKMVINCDIDCDTMRCKICNESIGGCDWNRNCKVKMANLPKTNTESTNKQNKVNGGPGTELKKLLSKIGINSEAGCGCNDRAKHIDFMENKDPGWTEKNIESIVDWMQSEAKNRKLPFLRIGAKTLVKIAIRNAKKQ
jgi:hypothetical protein